MTRDWLQRGHFVLAPTEPLLRPAITSTLFPQSSPAGRRVFRVCLVVMLAALLVLAAARLSPALIAVGALGVPLLFALYLRECDITSHVPRRLLALSAVLGAVLGTAGMLLTGQYVARTYELSVLAGMAMNRYLRDGIGIPLAAALLKLLPAVVVRGVSKPPRKVLDGFAIGALGALMFGAAASLTRLAPQFAVGLVASSRSVSGLMVEAVIAGFTVPLAAVASGGTVGVALWFTPDPAAAPEDRRRARVALAALAVAVVVIFVGVVITDIAGLNQLTVLALHLVLALAAIVVARLALQIALLYGVPDPAASPRPSAPPVPLRRVLALWTAGIVAAAGALVGLSAMVTDKPQPYRCPPDCGRPPVGIPVTALPRFVAPDGAFSVAYPAPGTAYDVSTDPSGVTAKLTVGDGGVLRLFAEPARGRDSRTIAMDLLKRKFPDVRVAYEIPNAMVGYQPGFGVAADRWPQGSSGSRCRSASWSWSPSKTISPSSRPRWAPTTNSGRPSGPGFRRGPACRWPRIWASTSTASGGGATRRTEERTGSRYGRPVDPRAGEAMPTRPLPEAGDLAATVIDDLAHRRWASVSARFDTTMREKLTDEGLAQAWAHIAALAGAYESRGDTESMRVAEFTVTNTPLVFEAGDFNARITFRDDQTIAGLFVLNPDVTPAT